jgi:hypothetical protein
MSLGRTLRAEHLSELLLERLLRRRYHGFKAPDCGRESRFFLLCGIAESCPKSGYIFLQQNAYALGKLDLAGFEE